MSIRYIARVDVVKNHDIPLDMFRTQSDLLCRRFGEFDYFAKDEMVLVVKKNEEFHIVDLDDIHSEIGGVCYSAGLGRWLVWDPRESAATFLEEGDYVAVYL